MDKEKEFELQMYRTAFLHNTLYSYIVDLTDNLIRQKPYVNEGQPFPKELNDGYPRNYDDYLRYWWTDRTSDDPEALKENSRDYLLELFNKGERFRESTGRTPDGEHGIHKSVILSENSEDGHIYALNIITDISQQVRSEKKINSSLKEAEERLEEVYAQLVDAQTGLWAVERDPGGNGRMIADRGMRILIGADEKATPEDCYNLWWAGVKEEDREFVQQGIMGMAFKDQAEVIYPWYYPDGTRIYVRCVGSPNKKYKGDGVSICGYHQNVTSMISLQKEKDKKIENLVGYRSNAEIMLDVMNLGRWTLEFEENAHARLICDPIMRRLIGADENATPEECYDIWSAGVPVDELEDTQHYFDSIRKNGTGDVTYRWYYPNGEEIWVRCCGILDKTAPDGIERMTGFHQDTSKLYYVEKKADVQSKYLEALNNTFSASLHINLARDEVIVINPGDFYEEFFADGHKTISDFFYLWAHYCLSEETLKANEDLLNIDNIKARLRKTDAFSVELETVYQGWISIQIVASDWDKDNEVTDILWLEQHIDEQKQVELEANKIKEEMALLLKGLSEAYYFVYRFDLKTFRCYELNAPSYLKNVIPYECDVRDVLRVWEKIDLEDEEFEDNRDFWDLSTLPERLTGNNIVSRDIRLQRGGWTHINIVCLDRDANGEPRNVLWMARQIDAEKKKEIAMREALETSYENAQRASKAKTLFLSNMSHDIRTPMNAITGFASIAKTHLDDGAKVKDCLDKIQFASEHLQQLINEILDMSRIESGKTTVELTETSVSEIVHTVEPLVQPQAQARRINFTVDMSSVKNDAILADPLKIRQILTNLLGNAVKFTEAGGSVTLRIVQNPSIKEKYGSYTILVKDTGIGMSEDFLKRVFLPFEREQTSTVSGIVGTGLGLAISKSLVELMGGVITVTSKQGVGSEFRIDIELEIQKDENDRNGADGKASGGKGADASDTDPYASLNGRHILLAEDNELNREIAVELLSDYGLRIDTAYDGKNAVDILAASGENEYELVLMDIQMPVMNGHEATRIIRKMEREDLKNLPVIAMTANAFAEDVQNSAMAGMNGHLAKPLDMKKVIDMLQKFLK